MQTTDMRQLVTVDLWKTACLVDLEKTAEQFFYEKKNYFG